MLNLIRFKATDNAILGRIYLNGAFVCYSLENKRKAIPCGSYTVENSTSPKFKRELPLIYNKEVSASRESASIAETPGRIPQPAYWSEWTWLERGLRNPSLPRRW